MENTDLTLRTDERRKLENWIILDGVRVVAAECHVASGTVTRALAGLEVRHGSVILIRLKLGERGK